MDFIVTLVIGLIVIGVLLWLLNICPFIDGEMKAMIRWVIIVVVVLWLLTMLLGYSHPVGLPWLRR